MKKIYSLLVFLFVVQGSIFAQALTGIKTIDPTGSGPDNYTTISAAIWAMNSQGVASGGVIFKVAAGAVFNESPNYITQTGLSATNQVIFQKEGSGANPVIYGKASSVNDYDVILGLSGSSYITFDGIDLVSDPTAGVDDSRIEYGLGIYNNYLDPSIGSSHITIKNCKINIERRTDGMYQYGINIYQNAASVSGIISDIIIDNVTLINGSSSIYANAQTIPNENFEIKNCHFGEESNSILLKNYASVIGITRCNNFSIHDNEIQNFVGPNLYGINVSTFSGVNNIYNNKIHNLRITFDGDNDLMGIAPASNDPNAILNIYNNLLYDFDGAKSSSVLVPNTFWNLQYIYLSGAAKYRVCNNTIVASSVNPHENTMLCWATINSEVKNNILADFSATGTTSVRSIFLSDGIIENNLFWIDESLPNNYTYRNQYKFREWQKWTTRPSLGYFLNNMSANPNFTNRTSFDFTLQSPSPASNNGQPLGIVTSSLNGTPRDASRPDIGAYEGDFGPATDLFPPVIRFQPIPHNALPEVKLTAEITDNVGVTSAKLWFRVKGSTASFNEATSAQFGNIWEFTFPALGAGLYEYFVCAKDASGNIISNGYIISGFDLASTGLSTTNPPANPDYVYSFSYNQTLAGNVSVGSGGTYPSLTKAGGLFDAINSSLITGDINAIIISDLDESGLINLQQWQESGVGNYTLSINTNSTVLRTITNTGGSMIFSGADRITVDGSFGGDNLNHIKIIAITGNPFYFVSNGTNGSKNITIKNCDIYSTSVACIAASGLNHSDFLLENLNIIKGSTGITLTSVTRPTIRNCTLGNTDIANSLFLRGIYLNGCSDIVVEKNTIRNIISSTDNTVAYGILLNVTTGGSISQNLITNISNFEASGPGIASGLCANTSSNLTISNNIISGVNGSGSPNYDMVTGLNMGVQGVVLYTCDNIKFFYNTVNLFGEGNTALDAECYSLSVENSVNMNLSNNIFSNTIYNSNNSYTCGVIKSIEAANIFRNNIYYIGGPKAYPGPFWIVGNTWYTFSGWRSNGFAPGNGRDLGSGSGDPMFTNSGTNDVSLQPSSPAINSGMPVSVTTDFYGNPRSATTPDIGALEDNSMALAIDIIPPVIEFIPFSNTPNTTPTFSATITDNVAVTAARMWYRTRSSTDAYTGIDGVQNVNTWSFTITSALTPDTEYEYFICAKDAASNIITNGINNVSLDASTVGLTVNNPAANRGYVRVFKITDFSITSGTISGAPFFVSNTKSASINIPFTITGTYSSNTFEAYLSDASGNFSGETMIGTLVSNNAGTIIATIPPAKASGTSYKIRIKSTNPAGIISSTSQAFAVINDNATPVVSLSTGTGTPVYLPFTVTIDFNEAVSGFELNMITATNSTLGDFATVIANRKYTVLVTPVNSGTVTVKVAANQVKDLADNFNGESNTISLSYIELGAPKLNIAAAGDLIYINTTPIAVTFTFDQNVTGFTNSDITVINGSKSSFSGSGKVYTANITPSGQGQVTISVADDAAINASSKGNSSSSLNLTFDNVNPGVSLVTVSGTGRGNEAFGIYIDFTEEIKGMTVDKPTVTNGAASDLIKESGTRYKVTITPSINEGTVTVSFASGIITDMANNGNTASSPNLDVVVDKIDPTITITRTSGSGGVTSTFNVTFSFSEDVTGFDVSDISVTNGFAGTFIKTNAALYTANITPDNGGDITVDLLANKAVDLAGNFNTAASPLIVELLLTATESLKETNLKVYPNPSAGLFKIETGTVADQIIRISDLNGKQVYSDIIKNRTTEVNLQNLPKGTYLIHIITGKQLITKKIILK